MTTLREQLLNGKFISREDRIATDGSIIVKENYTLQDLEEYIVNKIHHGKYEFLERNYEKIAKLYINKHDDAYKVGSIKQTFFVTIYLKYYLANIEPCISGNKLSDIFDSYYVECVCKDGTYGFEIVYPPFYVEDSWDLFNNSIICRKQDKSKYIIRYHNSAESWEDRQTWEKICEKYFESTLKALKNHAKGKYVTRLKPASTLSLDMNCNAHVISEYEEICTIYDEEIKKIINKEKLSNLFLIPTPGHPMFIIIRGNLVCDVGLYVEQGMLKFHKPDYRVLFKYDTIRLKQNENVVNFDATISPTYYKKSSVLGNALVGSFLGGTLGGYVGMAMATEANRKREELIKSYKPLMVELKLPELDMIVSCERMRGKRKLFIYINKAIYTDEKTNELMLALSNARSDRSCLEGELIKNFILDSDANSKYHEEEFQIYSFEKKELLAKECYEYVEFKSAIEIEKELIDKIKFVNQEYEKSLIAIRDKCDVDIKECDEKVLTLKNQIKELNVLKIKEKKQLKLEMQKMEEVLSSIKITRDNKIKEIQLSYENEKAFIEEELERIQLTKDILLFNKGILEAQKRIF